jgi:iron complex transport system permease protein
VLGASSAAALGAVLALYFGLAAAFPLALPLSAIITALLALGFVLVLAQRSESALTLVLAGLAVSTLATAAIALTLNLSPNPFAAMEITTWLLGSLEDRSMKHVVLAVPFILAGMGLLFWDRRALDALSLGEETAETLGFSLQWVRLRLVAGVALGVGAAVAVSGAIGFVGLIVPHILRPLIGPQPSRLLIPSALAGSLLLMASDMLVRIIPTTNELKLGVVTSFLGVPFFLVLLFKSRRSW